MKMTALIVICLVAATVLTEITIALDKGTTVKCSVQGNVATCSNGKTYTIKGK